MRDLVESIGFLAEVTRAVQGDAYDEHFEPVTEAIV